MKLCHCCAIENLASDSSVPDSLSGKIGLAILDHCLASQYILRLCVNVIILQLAKFTTKLDKIIWDTVLDS
jgi:hypothetical protein